MRIVFKIVPNIMTDGSGCVYSIDTPEGERIASTTSERAARDLYFSLNRALDDWQAKYGFDAVVA